jgi:serine/threonine-protein kinase HipA
MTYCKISLQEVSPGSKYGGYRNASFKKLFGSLKVSPVLAFSRSEFMQDSVKFTKGISISGVQQKLSLKIDDSGELMPVPRGGEFILKPSPEEFPFAAENEHAAMLISGVLDIETAACGLVTFADGELAYITRRFDRLNNGEKRHQEDLLQGFEEPSERKYDHSYEEAGKLILKMTDGKKVAVSDFFRRVVYAYLIGNNDLHLKNISLQRLEGGGTHYYDKLSPNYDCLFTDAFENIDSDGFLALDLFEDGITTEKYGYYGFPTGHDFIELCRRVEIPAVIFGRFIDLIMSKEPVITNTINNSYMPADMKQKAVNTVRDRLRALGRGILDDA